jgi:hypothetical protein
LVSCFRKCFSFNSFVFYSLHSANQHLLGTFCVLGTEAFKVELDFTSALPWLSVQWRK